MIIYYYILGIYLQAHFIELCHFHFVWPIIQSVKLSMRLVMLYVKFFLIFICPSQALNHWNKSHMISRNYGNFANCIGCIDSKYVRIKCPDNSGSMFYNYKSYFSVHLQGVCDAKYKFISVDIGAYRRQSDSGIFTETNIFKHLEAKSFNVPNYKPLPNTNTPMPFVLLGDQGYPLKSIY